MTCCLSCARKHVEIVEVYGRHFWVDDPAERSELPAEMACTDRVHDQFARLFDVGKDRPPAREREPFPLMQGRAVAKLAMKASCRHYLHEPRRRPQSTFIVVRHLHFLGNRGFGARNELCSHIDYSPLFSRF